MRIYRVSSYVASSKKPPVIQPLINLMRDRLLAYDILQMDETTVQVLKEPGKSAQSKSYLWVQRGGPPEHPLILYDYDPSRGQAVPQRLLEGFAGFLQTDGYEGYNAVVAGSEITHLGCWAHYPELLIMSSNFVNVRQ
jgi:transposase